MQKRQPIVLTEEELELIGEHRYRSEHDKGRGKITILCFVLAAVLTLALKQFSVGYVYIFGLFPAFIPFYLSMRLGNVAYKAGEKFAKENLGAGLEETAEKRN